jgi:hypothetical protein
VASESRFTSLIGDADLRFPFPYGDSTSVTDPKERTIIVPRNSVWKTSDGAQVPVRYVAEQHVREDLGRIPTAQDWLLQITPQRWMYGRYSESGIMAAMPRS